MKKYISVLTLLLLAVVLSAESVWTGNAAVGGSAEFPGSSEVFRAASNSFPAGTVLQVTNPRGGAQVNVTVTGRLESPGVFILIERSAADTIGLPSDHVQPVRVTPVSLDVFEEPEAALADTGELTEDPDYNPAASLEDNPGALRTAPVPESIIEEPAESETETILTYDLTEPEDDINESIVVMEAGSDDGESRIYFLMPADLRPPELIIPEEKVEDRSIVPTVYNESEIPEYKLGDPGHFIQIGAYRNRAVLEESARRLNRNAPGYPLSIATEAGSGGPVYKLLIGPLMPAETGIVLKTARSSAFPDAFPYSP